MGKPTLVLSRSPNKYDVLDGIINDYIAENNIPGLNACVVRGDNVEWSSSYGLSDIGNNITMRSEAVINIASVSKLFTATAIVQLWEKNSIDLDADVSTYLPFSIRNPKFLDAPITIRQLLTHTSSIIDGSTLWKSYACGDPTISLKSWITNYFRPGGEFYNVAENFSEHKPGSIENYSNVGYGLLGYVVEVVSGRLFSAYCRENIFVPLGMENTGWFISEIDTTYHIIPYVYMSEELRDDMANHFNQLFPGETEFALGANIATCLYSCPNYPDGYVRTSTNELSKFLIACMNDGKYNDARILEEQTLCEMMSQQTELNINRGLGWHKEGVFWGHNGSDAGVQTEMFFEPETKIGVIVIQNSLESESFDILKRIHQIAVSEDE